MFGRADAARFRCPTRCSALEDDVEATRVFATDEAGTMVLDRRRRYAERRSRWRVEIVRWPVLVSAASW